MTKQNQTKQEKNTLRKKRCHTAVKLPSSEPKCSLDKSDCNLIVNCQTWINDECEEYLMNLVAQGFFSEAWEVKMKLLMRFETSIDYICGSILNEELKKMKLSPNKSEIGLNNTDVSQQAQTGSGSRKGNNCNLCGIMIGWKKIQSIIV